ncbi:MAG: hypothetical protein IPH20_18455 [Bacteroidales bacterium]|nr:hypothetical protein [Bacteroidales bacterium]
MMKHIIIGILFLCQLTISAQDKVITGRITDRIGKPLSGVSICQDYTDNCNYSDYNGVFHILIDNKFDNKLEISYPGYKSLWISNSDTIKGIIHLVMYEDTSYIEMPYPRRIFKFGFITFLQVDFIFNDFNDFKPLLKDYNVDLMNKSNGIFSAELAGLYKGYYMGLSFGCANDGVYDHDSLDIEFNTTQYGLHFGYNLVNTKRLLITPKVAIKWNRYRLLNNDKDKSLPMEQYVSERDLDIRFNQITGFAGLNLSYKIYRFNLLPTDYWTFGIYGGYAFKLHDKPWIYSRGNRLASNGKIAIENYNIGIHFSFNIDGR